MERYLTKLVPIHSQEQIDKEDELAKALELTSPRVLLSSPPIKAPKTPIGRLREADLSPVKQLLGRRAAESNRLSLDYYVQTQGLRDDFYSTVIAHNPKNDLIAIAMNTTVRFWSQQDGASLASLPRVWGKVTCLAFNNAGYLAIGYQAGIIAIFNYDVDCIFSRVQLENTKAFPTCCVFKSADRLFVGDSKGGISGYQVHIGDVTRKITLRAHRTDILVDIIAGMNIVNDVLVTGSNDGFLTFWDTTEKEEDTMPLVFKFKFNHVAAVKAIVPFSDLPNLVLTGGGRADRTLRLWNVKTGRCMMKIQLPSQITGLVWLDRDTLFVALGHARGGKIRLGQVFRFEDGNCKYLLDVCGEGRAVHAVKTQDGVCVATNKESLAFCRWQTKPGMSGRLLKADLGPLSPNLR